MSEGIQNEASTLEGEGEGEEEKERGREDGRGGRKERGRWRTSKYHV